MTFRNRSSVLLAAMTVVLAAACSEDDGVGPIPPGAADIAADITANRTLFAETTYTIKGFVHVSSGATLTIQPGTTIQGDFGTQGSSLFVLRGARIMAVGTADRPIVFTSSRPDGQRAPGDWGGLIIVGNGLLNRDNPGGIAVEGTGTSGSNPSVIYSGGTTNTDDSGELRYVRVEYAGFAPQLDNELNAFTFAAVGSGTKLSYLQALAGLDDSFEWFGGAVDADHLVSYESGDDHFDMAEGYSGRLQYLIAFQSARLTPTQGGSLSGDPQGIENDGCNSTILNSGCNNAFNSTPLTIPLIANFTLVGTGATATSGGSGGYGIVLRRGTGGYYLNGIVARWPRAGVTIRDADTYARAGSTQTPDIATTDLAMRNILFLETSAAAPMFEAGSGRFNFDATANALTAGAATTQATFTAFPATTDDNTTVTAFDWTPVAGSAPATGGLATFPTGKIATKATGASSTGNTFAGTAYVGAAAPGGPKWWQGWTKYDQR
jgi:hypothetical protein